MDLRDFKQKALGYFFPISLRSCLRWQSKVVDVSISANIPFGRIVTELGGILAGKIYIYTKTA